MSDGDARTAELSTGRLGVRHFAHMSGRILWSIHLEIACIAELVGLLYFVRPDPLTVKVYLVTVIVFQSSRTIP